MKPVEMVKQVKVFFRKQKLKRNFAKCMACPEGENIFIKKTGEISLISISPLVQDIIKVDGTCGMHQHQRQEIRV